LLRLLPGTPPGRYWLETKVFRRDDSLQLTPQAGTPTGPDPAWARVGSIEVLPGGAAGLPADAAMAVLHATPLGGGLTLAGWTLPTKPVSAGDVAPVSLLWQASQPLTGTSLDAQILSSAGQLLVDLPVAPGGAAYPVARWPSPAVVRDQIAWRIPSTAAGGRYEVVIHSSQGSADLGHIQVTAPPHLFARPAAATTLDQTIGFAQLAGFTLSSNHARPGGTLTVELVWQSLADTTDADRVFVHLRGPNGLPITQSDSAPADWQRPTSGWVPGEYILDRHSLGVPANAPSQTYDLVVGLYNPATGARVGEVSLGPVTIP
jgi:hypothetical protein